MSAHVGSDSAVDPLTGASRYIPGKEARPGTNTTSPHHSVLDEEQFAKSRYAYLPQTTPSTFPIANVGNLIAKLMAANDTAVSKLTEEECAQIRASLSASPSSSSPLLDSSIVIKLLQWPPESFLPVGGIISHLVLRSNFAHSLSQLRFSGGNDVIRHVIAVTRDNQPAHAIALRFIANAVVSPVIGEIVVANLSAIFDFCTLLVSSKIDAVRSAAVTVLLNIAVVHRQFLDDVAITRMLVFLNTVLSTEGNYNIVGSALLALGTLLWDLSGARQRAAELGTRDKLHQWIHSANETVREVAMEVSRVLQG
jgi:hypothetical protein